MSTPNAAASTSQQQQIPSPTILLFARGVIALMDLWPALSIAVAEQWGGPESVEKKTWMTSIIVDEFESRAIFLPSIKTGASSNAEGPQVDPKTATDPPLDHDDLGDLINQMMSDEFDANIEDDSIDGVTADIIRLWRDILQPPSLAAGSPDLEVPWTPERIVEALERKAGDVRKRGVNASSGGGPEEMNGDMVDGEEEDGDWTDSEDEDAPQLITTNGTTAKADKEREKVEPVIDEDGFELVQKGRRR